nr:hypothetical protein [uncultured Cohaesibacter sp.]
MTFNRNLYIVASDGSAYNLDGKSIFFSFNRFKRDICENGHCFVCGAPPSSDFNNEHVFPDWLQRLCLIQNKTLTLPNEGKIKYGTYKIPCCSACNTQLSEIYEKPISRAIRNGFGGLYDFLQDGGLELLFGWLNLIFVKVHLKDFKNRVVLDRRLDEGFIGEKYDLNKLHHFHAVARAPTANVKVNDAVLGSISIYKIESSNKSPVFDYCDHLDGRTLLLRINDLAIICVLDDCGATAEMLSKQLEVIPSLLSEIQLREIYARYLSANLHLISQPMFRTEFFNSTGFPEINVALPDLKFHDYVPTVFGEMLLHALGHYIDVVTVNDLKGQKASELLSSGNVSFLFDELGNPRER